MKTVVTVLRHTSRTMKTVVTVLCHMGQDNKDCCNSTMLHKTGQ